MNKEQIIKFVNSTLAAPQVAHITLGKFLVDILELASVAEMFTPVGIEQLITTCKTHSTEKELTVINAYEPALMKLLPHVIEFYTSTKSIIK